MKLLIASLFAFSSAAFAANIVPVSYHEGTLVSFSMPASGSNCAVSSEQSCSDINGAQYMVKSEGILYALTPVNGATSSIAAPPRGRTRSHSYSTSAARLDKAAVQHSLLLASQLNSQGPNFGRPLTHCHDTTSYG